MAQGILTRRPVQRHTPGEPELWMLILGDLTIFALFFGVWCWQRQAQPRVFTAGHEQLNTAIGLANTVVLISSSLAVARGLQMVRNGMRSQAARSYVAAAVLGAAFVVLKLVEYREHFVTGASPMTNDYYMYYFVFTGIHLVHVLAGIAGLTYLAHRCRRPGPSVALCEGIGVYWHMVDLLWIALFYLIYLT